MNRTELVQFRVEPRHAEKLRQIKQATGVPNAELFRRMIENIQIRPIGITVTMGEIGDEAGEVLSHG